MKSSSNRFTNLISTLGKAIASAIQVADKRTYKTPMNTKFWRKVKNTLPFQRYNEGKEKFYHHPASRPPVEHQTILKEKKKNKHD